tara:strand:- start:116944 stop:117684 length:741 start_codon:yes stop_codon:yes gene_type:complete
MTILDDLLQNNKSIKNIVILSGAGISAESGIRTFRDSNGLWEDHSIEEVATPEAFQKNPKLVHNFYNQRRKQLLSSEVDFNKAHQIITEIEDSNLYNIVVITQNVDDLHERSGTKNVIHMHGELLKTKCTSCNISSPIDSDLDTQSICSHCDEKGTLRPDIVWFGEMPYQLNEIETYLNSADLFLSIGTSGQVYPAAMFVSTTPSECIKLEINIEKTNISNQFDYSIQESSSKGMEILKNYLLPQK